MPRFLDKNSFVQLLPDKGPPNWVSLTHGDLYHDILGAGILEWENAGYYPETWPVIQCCTAWLRARTSSGSSGRPDRLLLLVSVPGLYALSIHLHRKCIALNFKAHNSLKLNYWTFSSTQASTSGFSEKFTSLDD
jgi:hypothetical protein